jgi:hypothetical protein
MFAVQDDLSMNLVLGPSEPPDLSLAFGLVPVACLSLANISLLEDK